MAGILGNLKADLTDKRAYKDAAIAVGGGTTGVLASRELTHWVGKVKYLKELEEKHPRVGPAVKHGLSMAVLTLLGLSAKRYVGEAGTLAFIAGGAGHEGAKIVGKFLPPSLVMSGVPGALKEAKAATGNPSISEEAPRERADVKKAELKQQLSKSAGALPDGSVGRFLSNEELRTQLSGIRAA